MTIDGLDLELPPSLSQRIKEMAEASDKPLREILIQTIRNGLPPTLNTVPKRFKVDLHALSRLSDEILLDVMRQELDQAKQDRYAELLKKNERNALNDAHGRQALEELREEADLMMYRRAYAAALLKWRGHNATELN